MNAVITYIFGKNKELLRTPITVTENTEYICVTDQKQLTSKIWHIVYDTIPEANCVRDKMVYVKYNPFKYTTANKICVLDGTIHIIKSMQSLFDGLDNVDLMVKKHPQRNNLYDELVAWQELRGLSNNVFNKFIAMSDVDNIDLTNDFLIESCVIGYANTHPIRSLCKIVLEYMKYIGDGNTLCPTNQCVLTYLLEKFSVNFNWLSQASFAIRYKHGSWFPANR